MKKSYRLVFFFVFLFAVAAGVLQAYLDRARLEADIRVKLQSLGVGLDEGIANVLEGGQRARLQRLLHQFSRNESSSFAVVCSGGKVFAADRNVAPSFCAERNVAEVEASGKEANFRSDVADSKYLVHVRKIDVEGFGGSAPVYSLAVFHPLESVAGRMQNAFLRVFLTALTAGLAAFVLYELLTRWILRQSLRVLVRWTRGIFRNEPTATAPRLRELDRKLPEEFRELTKELSSLALKMRQERLRLVWNSQVVPHAPVPDKRGEGDRWQELRATVNEVLRGRQLIIVANREPYSHERRPGDNGQIEVLRPASGVVTALEPIMRLCGGGIWVAHGSGNADREVVDDNDEVRVPPENPTYKLRRVWLCREEENGYYYGFANEGLWPLCHLAHTRPTFRLSDWEMYKRVNQKFAEKTLRDIDPSRAVILVQDYHYALLPRMLRERAPKAAIELFWHIPWPNPEAFGICPQYKDLLQGMLGADVVGFHTQFHCNNFLETCDRYLECRVDWERFSVTVENHETLVRSYPISIAAEPVPPISEKRRLDLRARYKIHTSLVALGVDRLDYTKGLLERIAGVERFLEKYPQYVGKFTFVEMGTPSRVHIASYRALIDEVEHAIDRVNRRFGNVEYQPVILLKGHFDWKDVAEFYQLGQVCLVTSLHDGMNLVAKEYVWSQAPEEGALILSRFTGAARELSEAIIVNPYSTEEIADALFATLNWSREERAERMSRMREKVEKHNAFRWATDLLAGVNAKA